MRKFSMLLAALAALSTLLIGGAGVYGAPSAQSGPLVQIGDFWFCNAGDSACHTSNTGDVDSAVTIAAGETVQWNWTGASTHSVTACSGSDFATCGEAQGFDSGIKSSGTFSRAFSQAGTFYYRCQVHPAEMHGQVTVTGTATGGGGAQPAAPAPAGAAQMPQTGGAPSDGGSVPYSLLLSGAAVAVILAGGLALRARRANRRTKR